MGRSCSGFHGASNSDARFAGSNRGLQPPAALAGAESSVDRSVRRFALHPGRFDRYLNLADLLLYLAASDAYVTPYLNPDQVVSGTLAYAVGCGKPVVSTPYLYAKELLKDGRGIVVPFDDPKSMSDAFLALANDGAFRDEIGRRAYEFSRPMTWDRIGKRYSTLLEDNDENVKWFRSRPPVESIRTGIAGNSR